MKKSLPKFSFRDKIRLVLLVLFTFVTALGILGGYHLLRIAKDSNEMMRNNLYTLNYTQEMWQALNESISILGTQDLTSTETRVQLRKSFDHFELYLGLQSDFINQEREQALLDTLRADFETFKSNIRAFESQGEVPLEVMTTSLDMHGILNQVYEINRESIQEKTDATYRQANRVTLAMILFGFFFFIFSVLAFFFFPDTIARPLQELSDGIREIARKNYGQRLAVRTDDEFGEVADSFNQMAEQLAVFEELNYSELVSQSRRIDTIIEQLNEPIIGLDRDNLILFINKKALELISMPEAQVMKRPALEVARINEPLREILKEVLEKQDTSGRSYPSFTIMQNGKTFYFEKDIIRIDEEDPGKGYGAVVILKNITEFKEQDLAKTHFMATLSHELKTPISAIDMSLGLLRDARIGPLNDDQRELVQTIRDNSNRLLRMVNEILDLSKIETGVIEMSKEEVRAEELVERALENTQVFWTEKAIRIGRSIEPGLPLLHLDVQKTTAVLTNFLTNAIRYSPDGSSILTTVRRDDRYVVFSVTDEGPGIPEEEQSRLFQRYSRSRNDRTKGTGLGLAISKEFVEKQGGKIWMESKVGEGSTFSFAIPVEE